MTLLPRRSFLKALGAISSIPVWSRLASATALAPTTTSTGYRAAVCIALRGGNDANNLIVPLQPNAYAQYANVRGSLALPYAGLLPLGTNPLYGLNPSLPNLQRLYNQNQASVVAGIGALHAPVTKAQITARQANLPALFMHDTGQHEWESGTINPYSAQGWGGQVLDALAGRGGSLPGVISVAGNSLFLLGQQSLGYTLAQANNYVPGLPNSFGTSSQALTTEDAKSPFTLVHSAASVRGNMLANQSIVSGALAAGGTLSTVFPKTAIGTNLSAVAKMIAGRNIVGGDRQMFFSSQVGYDTHVDQLSQQNGYFQQLDAAIGSFYSAMQELGLMNEVLLFTISDFSRTYQPNTNGGTDHAWSGHQLVCGGGQGGRFMGSMPSGELGSSDDMDDQGVWIPSTSSVQLAAGVARWLGVSDTNIAAIFPDLANFPIGALSL